MGAAVVGARVYRNALTVCKAVHSVWTDLVASDHNLKLIHFKELVNQFSAEKLHIVLLQRVTDQIWLHSNDFIISCRVAP